MDKLINGIIKKVSFVLKAEGTSMLPILHSNDLVQYKKVNFKQVDINDFILVRKNRHLFTHRTIYKTKEYLITKGDNNLESDGKIAPQNLLAKVVSIKRNGQIINPDSLCLIQSTLYFQEIIKIKTTFEKEKINFVFLKGLPLHLYFEGSHPKRIYADCDVLIDKKDFQKAEKIIEKFGYKKTIEGKKQVENNYFKVINGFPVVFDIHMEPAFLMTQFSGLEALYPQKLINRLTEELLNNKKQIIIKNEKFLILNSKFLILYLALHLFHHNFRGAFRYEFLDKVIRIGLDSRLRGNDNKRSRNKFRMTGWEEIAQKIKKYRLENFVYPVFILLIKYYQSPIPRSFMNSIYPNFINFMNFIDFKNLKVFDDEPRVRAGIIRFKNLFFLSPNPWWKKIFVFTNPSVIYSISWIILKKLSSFFSNRK